MSINAPTTTDPTAPPTNLPTRLPDSLQPLATEVETFYRELPRLLAEGETNRYAVIRDREIHGIWDTSRDAAQYGYEKFDDGRFLTQKIDPRLLPALANIFEPTSEESA
jgi:hypothetical protein